ncbi:MAG TPA: CRISPR-associated endonuclease Cas2 [Phycisphaerae bacterium]|nr:CRISPR-associated endonuclease Cas2 [Phycisphaerae bacterium]HON69278.1 CRISPR-associated endonuclease Cas2 [Phycisphaerae bacterium]HPP29288.1 CRISPR-associated endonuclease Cas2 [Phycisphaerae bacterium]HPU28687.1 CRISPR-associated endonuclease Cas2 [Phycisphaerae bacterium]
MARRHYMIAYDISDDKRRTHVFEMLMGQGEHVQFSVFFCELNPQELASLRGKLLEVINCRDDQVIILDLGEITNPLENILDCLGMSYNPRARVQVV